MNCPNCGAAMDLVESRRYFQCRHCSTFHFPDTIEADGIRIVGTPADGQACPVCKAVMAHALLDDDHPIDFCARCRGVLLPRETFAGVVNKRRAWATDPPAEPVLLDRAALARALSCPTCGGRFETYSHYGPGNVVIDNCTKCDLIWLDFGEMKQIVDAPGRDRGSRQLPRIDNDYLPLGPAPIEDPQSRDLLSALLRLFLRG
jgi:Zn-finger nucleic acid-binding protein